MRALALIPWVRRWRYARLLARIEILERDLFPEWFPAPVSRAQLKQMLDAQNRLEAVHQAHLYDLNAARTALMDWQYESFVKAVRTRQ